MMNTAIKSRLTSIELERSGTTNHELTSRNTHIFHAKNQLISVTAGTLWITLGGEDFIVRSGASLRLAPSGDGLVTVAPIRSAFATYTLVA